MPVVRRSVLSRLAILGALMSVGAAVPACSDNDDPDITINCYISGSPTPIVYRVKKIDDGLRNCQSAYPDRGCSCERA